MAKGTRKRVNSPITKSSAKELAREVAREAIEAKRELDEEEGAEPSFFEEEEEVEEEITDEQLEKKIRKEAEKDVFTFYANRYADKGELCSFRIYREGQLIKRVYHPYSWEKLQEDCGGGKYKVICYDGKDKYLMQETQSVSEPVGSIDDEAKENSTNQMFNYLKEINEQNQAEAARREMLMEKQAEKHQNHMMMLEQKFKQEARENQERAESMMSRSTDSMATMMTAMMQMQNSQQQSQQNMMLAMMGNNQNSGTSSEQSINQLSQNMMQMMMQSNKDALDAIRTLKEESDRKLEKVSEGTSRMLEKMQESTQRMIESLSKEKEGQMSPLEMLKFAEEYKAKGQAEMERLMELVELKAAAKHEEDSEDNGSVINTLIKSIGPKVMDVVAASNGAPRIPMQNPQPRGELSATEYRSTDYETEARSIVQSQRASTRDDSKSRGANGGQNSQGVKVIKPKPVENSQEKPSQQFSKEQLAEIKQRILEILGPIVAQHLLSEQKDFQIAAEQCIIELRNQRINPVAAIKLVSALDIINYADSFGINDQQYNGVTDWLRNLYAEIQAQC